jgi:hypothetical protein
MRILKIYIGIELVRYLIKIEDGYGGCVNVLQWTEYAALTGGDVGEMEMSNGWNKHCN